MLWSKVRTWFKVKTLLPSRPHGPEPAFGWLLAVREGSGKAREGAEDKFSPTGMFVKMVACPQEVVGVGVDADLFSYRNILISGDSLLDPSRYNSLVMGRASALAGLPLSSLSCCPSWYSHVCLPPPFLGRPCTWGRSLWKQPQVGTTIIVSTCRFGVSNTFHLLHSKAGCNDFPGASVCSVVIRCLHFLRLEVTHSPWGPGTPIMLSE